MCMLIDYIGSKALLLVFWEGWGDFAADYNSSLKGWSSTIYI